MKNKYSLKSKIEFNNLFKKGKKIRSNELLISYLDSKDFKIGISVPKKIGNAPTRNKTKRQLKNIIYKANIFDYKKHIIVIVNKNWMELNFKQREILFKNQISKLKNINEK